MTDEEIHNLLTGTIEDLYTTDERAEIVETTLSGIFNESLKNIAVEDIAIDDKLVFIIKIYKELRNAKSLLLV